MCISYLNIYLSQKCLHGSYFSPTPFMWKWHFALKGNPQNHSWDLPLPECILPKWCICKYFKDTFITILLKRIHCDVKTVRNLVIKRRNSFKCNSPPPSLSEYGESHNQAGLDSLSYFLMLEPGSVSEQPYSQHVILYPRVSPVAQTVKSPPAVQETDPGLIPGSGRSPRGGNGHPLQYSFLEIPMNGGAWWATVYGVA